MDYVSGFRLSGREGLIVQPFIQSWIKTSAGYPSLEQNSKQKKLNEIFYQVLILYKYTEH